MWTEQYLFNGKDYSKPKLFFGEQLWKNTKFGRFRNNCKSTLNGLMYFSPESIAKQAEKDKQNYPVSTLTDPTTPSGIELSSYINQSLYNHLVKWSYHISRLETGLKWIYHISGPMTGTKWKKAVRKNWELARECICESCVRRNFVKNWYGFASGSAQTEVADVVEMILKEDFLWTSMFDDQKYDADMKSHVEMVEEFRQAESIPKVPKPCKCARRKRDIKEPSISTHQFNATLPPIECIASPDQPPINSPLPTQPSPTLANSPISPSTPLPSAKIPQVSTGKVKRDTFFFFPSLY